MRHSRWVLIQGIGCTETGARIVLHELLKAAPPGNRYFVLTTRETAKELVGKFAGRFADNSHVLGLSHRVFGRWLRVPLECMVALLVLTRVVNRVVNLSHYGLCPGRRYGLYIHSPLLMDVGHDTGWGEGRPNWLKRWMLHTCIRGARPFVLQTTGMQAQLIKYCEAKGLPVPPSRVMRPEIEVPVAAQQGKRLFPFQLFYPTSRFAHKRAELAIASGSLAHARQAEVGLVITTPPLDHDFARTGVHETGRISHADVYSWFAGSDALLFTSGRETLGLPLLEALEFGLPVIAPRLPYAVEILGEAGCYFDEATPESVVAAILRCKADHNDWRVKIKKRAAEIARNAASWSEHWSVLLPKD